MKSKINFILAALMGGVFALGGFLAIQPHTQAYKQNMTLQPVSSNATHMGAAGVPFDFTLAAEKAKKSVVYIETKSDPMANQRRQDNSRRQSPRSMDDLFDIEKLFRGFQFDLGPREGKGSGVILTADGIIVTNNHVINNADEINIKLMMTANLWPRKLVSTPAQTLLSSKSTPPTLPLWRLATAMP
jgi:serine protease Do